MQEELELSHVTVNPRIECERVFRRELRHLQRQQRPRVAVEIGGADADNWQLEAAPEDRVELRDPARHRIQVIPGDTIEQNWPQGLELRAFAGLGWRTEVLILLQLGGYPLPR